jgi:nucleotide-binding universal stress UspA family protein
MSKDERASGFNSHEAGRFENVVIGTSLTPESSEFLRSALAVTRALGAKVRLVHAIPLQPIAYGFEGIVGPDIMDRLKELQTDDLALQIQETKVLESELIGADVVAGAPHQALEDVASASHADLIIVGAFENPGPGGRLLGSTTDRVIRSVHCPVLILRKGLPLPPSRVLAPVDLSPSSALAVETGIRLLTQMNAVGSTAVETFFVLSPLSRGLPLNSSPQEIDRRAREELLRFTSEHTQGWEGTIETRLRIGEPRAEVLKELEGHPVDLVVVGSHGHGKVHRALIGSVAGQISRRATCSVLFVPHREDGLAARDADREFARFEAFPETPEETRTVSSCHQARWA